VRSSGPLAQVTAEVPKAVGKIGLVASAFEAKCGADSAEVDQCRFVHLVAVFAKSISNSNVNTTEMITPRLT
jgi:hypothetical protein